MKTGGMVTTSEALARLTERAGAITRQLFAQSIRPLMVKRGDAERHGKTWLYRDASLGPWGEYLRARRERVRSGEWMRTRPYSLEDFSGTTSKENR